MRNTVEQSADLIELGTASVETKGIIGPIPDLMNGREPASLSED